MDTNALLQVAQVATSASNQATLNTVIVAVIGFFGILVTTIGGIFLAKINKTTTDSRGEVKEIKEATLQIHGMVNKPFGVALETAATAMETVAEMTRHPDHRQAAVTARSVSNDHNSSMAAWEMAQRVAESAKATVTVVSKPEAVAVKVEKGATVLVVDPAASSKPPTTAEEVNQQIKESAEKTKKP